MSLTPVVTGGILSLTSTDNSGDSAGPTTVGGGDENASAPGRHHKQLVDENDPPQLGLGLGAAAQEYADEEQLDEEEPAELEELDELASDVSSSDDEDEMDEEDSVVHGKDSTRHDKLPPTLLTRTPSRGPPPARRAAAPEHHRV